MAFVIRLERRRFVGHNPPPEQPQRGWRRLRWVASPELAEIFSTEQSARDFATRELEHDQFEVVAVVPRRPGNHPTGGGTPIAVAATG